MKKKYRVRCMSCSGNFHQTTEKFDPHKTFNGTMFELQPLYGPSGHNWQTFPQDESIRDADIECPWCGSCYVGMSKFLDEKNNSFTLADLKNEMNLTFTELRQKAVAKGVFKVGMSKEQLIEAIASEEEAQA